MDVLNVRSAGHSRAGSAVVHPHAITAINGSKAMFEQLILVFEEQGLPYCILAAYDDYPQVIASDVDFMIPSAWTGRLPALIALAAARCGAQLVQCFNHETTAAYYVMARPEDDHISYLFPDSCADYRRRGRLWLQADRVLANRRRHAHGFWIPSPGDAFAYYLIKKIGKGVLDPLHAAQLSARYAEDPQACGEILRTLLPEASARLVDQAARSEDWSAIGAELPALKSALRGHAPSEPLFARALSASAEIRRIVDRIARPSGLCVAFLGPDGSGKSSVISQVCAELGQSFRRVHYRHLRPRLFRNGSSGGIAVTDPHAMRPRGMVASLAKLLYFWMDFMVGGVIWLRPQRARSSLLVFDRYYHDILADPRRYRYGGPLALAKWLGRFVPQPDIAFVLDAPPEILRARKQEVAIEESARQREAYRNVASEFSSVRIVDATLPLDQVVSCILREVVDFLEMRASARLGFDRTAQAPRKAYAAGPVIDRVRNG